MLLHRTKHGILFFKSSQRFRTTARAKQNAHVTQAQYVNKNTKEMHVKLSPMKLMKTGISLMGGKGATKLVGTSLQKTLPPKHGPGATKLIAL